mmetsp:Transcript_79589/g.237071  ORF Transcript_79589/g.237071 Transcript_79589/m.237071 type:complete len:257 (+) Transcript_79589:231-1001(+)
MPRAAPPGHAPRASTRPCSAPHRCVLRAEAWCRSCPPPPGPPARPKPARPWRLSSSTPGTAARGPGRRVPHGTPPGPPAAPPGASSTLGQAAGACLATVALRHRLAPPRRWLLAPRQQHQRQGRGRCCQPPVRQWGAPLQVQLPALEAQGCRPPGCSRCCCSSRGLSCCCCCCWRCCYRCCRCRCPRTRGARTPRSCCSSGAFWLAAQRANDCAWPPAVQWRCLRCVRGLQRQRPRMWRPSWRLQPLPLLRPPRSP